MINEPQLRERLTELADTQDDASADPIPLLVAAGHRRLARRRLLVAGSSATAVVLAGGLLLGITGLLGSAGPKSVDQPPVAEPGTPASTVVTGHGDQEVVIDLGPMNAAQIQSFTRPCLTTVMPKGAVGTVGHAIRYRTTGTKIVRFSITVQDRKTGLVVGCHGLPTVKDRTGKIVPGFTANIVGGPAVSTSVGRFDIPAPTAAAPAIKLASFGTTTAWIEKADDGKADAVGFEDWFRVGPQVAELRQRYVFRGLPGPWMAAKAVDGYVFLSTTANSDLNVGETVKLELQAVGADGRLLPAPVNLVERNGTFGPALSPATGTTMTATGKVQRLPGNAPFWDITFTW